LNLTKPALILNH